MTTVKQEKTLLDEFAMAPLTGMMASRLAIDTHTTAWIVQESYRLACDMMKERQKYETK